MSQAFTTAFTVAGVAVLLLVVCTAATGSSAALFTKIMLLMPNTRNDHHHSGGSSSSSSTTTGATASFRWSVAVGNKLLRPMVHETDAKGKTSIFLSLGERQDTKLAARVDAATGKLGWIIEPENRNMSAVCDGMVFFGNRTYDALMGDQLPYNVSTLMGGVVACVDNTQLSCDASSCQVASNANVTCRTKQLATSFNGLNAVPSGGAYTSWPIPIFQVPNEYNQNQTLIMHAVSKDCSVQSFTVDLPSFPWNDYNVASLGFRLTAGFQISSGKYLVASGYTSVATETWPNVITHPRPVTMIVDVQAGKLLGTIDAQIGVGDDHVLVAGSSNRLEGYAVKDQTLLWHVKTLSSFSAPCMVSNGGVVVAINGAGLAAFDIRTGQQYWQYADDGEYGLEAPVFIRNGALGDVIVVRRGPSLISVPFNGVAPSPSP